MPKFLIFSVGPIIVLCFVSLAFAPADPIPHLINYQGMLNDDVGNPAGGSHDLTFSIYSVSSGGSALWTETHSGVLVENGLFNVTMGSETSGGIPSSIFDGAERYLGIKVGTDPELAPRTRLVSVGYAYRSEKADTALYAVETVSPESDGDWTISGSNIHSAVSGNVGIGTTSPSTKLDVNGDINIGSVYRIEGEPVVTSDLDLGCIFVGVGAGGNDTMGLASTFVGYRAGYSNQASGNTFVGYHAGRDNSTGYGNTFLGGRAGVGNTIGNGNTFVGAEAGWPNTTGGLNTFVGYFAGSSNTTGNSNTFLGSGAGDLTTTGWHNTFLGSMAGRSNGTGEYNTCVGTEAGYSNQEGDGNVFVGYKAGYSEGGSNKLYIANGPDHNDVLIYGNFASGRLGIGTTSPDYTLDVNGNLGVRGEIRTNQSGNPSFEHRSTDGGTPYIDFSDNLGTDYDMRIILNGDDSLAIQGGNLGIGTAGPTEKLHVVGNIYCTGKLTSDGGNDPPYVLYNKETRESIKQKVAKEVPEDKLDGAVLFWNSEAERFEVYLPMKGEFRDLSGNLLVQVRD